MQSSKKYYYTILRSLAYLESSKDVGEVPRPHVLGGIHAEASHPEVNEVVEVVSDLASHVVVTQRQVRQVHQTTVSHLKNKELEKTHYNVVAFDFKTTKCILLYFSCGKNKQYLDILEHVT
jgi:hypothetical protein